MSTDVYDWMRARLKEDYERQLGMIAELEWYDRQKNESEKAAPTTNKSKPLEIWVSARSKDGSEFGLKLPEKFDRSIIMSAGAKFNQAMAFINTWKKHGWIESVSRGWYVRTKKFGFGDVPTEFTQEQLEQRALHLAGVLNQETTSGQPINKAAWKCSRCGQMNSGWSDRCGRCDTIQNATIVPQGAIEIVKHRCDIDLMPGVQMIDRTRKIILGFGANNEFTWSEIRVALQKTLEPWSVQNDRDMVWCVNKLVSNGEVRKLGLRRSGRFRILDLKPVSPSIKSNPKEEEWKKLRETISVPRDVLDEVGREQ